MTNFFEDVANIQGTVNNVINAENTRLQAKKDGIDAAYATQQRTIVLNQSYASRMRAWSYLITILAIAIVISIVLMNAKNIIPPSIADLLIVVVMSIAIIWAYLVYVDINTRDRNDYNTLSMDSTRLVNPNSISSGSQQSANKIATDKANANLSAKDQYSSLLGGGASTCQGAECCPTTGNWKYDVQSNKCISA
jgi:hypothetical protein